MFGLQPAQVDEVASIMSLLTQHWRELIAGSEGFLVGGPEDHAVAWGELVSGMDVAPLNGSGAKQKRWP